MIITYQKVENDYYTNYSLKLIFFFTIKNWTKKILQNYLFLKEIMLLSNFD